MKKLLPYLAASLFFLLVFSFSLLAQDSTAVSSVIPTSWLPVKVSYWVAVFLALYEVFARYVPTVKSYSVITWFVRFVQLIFPDKSSKGPDHA
jgi:hypothetical protein